MTRLFSVHYFPAIVCAEYDSPVDALLGLHVPYDEVMDLVAASWHGGEEASVLATVDGGRAVAAAPLAGGRWAACNAFPELASVSRREAERRLAKVVKRGRRGMILVVPGPVLPGALDAGY